MFMDFNRLDPARIQRKISLIIRATIDNNKEEDRP